MKTPAFLSALLLFAATAFAQTAPVIVSPPANTTEVTGNNVLFSATATGAAPLSYQWSFNGTPIPGATSHTLFLPAITPSKAGNYTITVSNSLGSVTSTAAQLSVRSTAAVSAIDSNFVPPPIAGASPTILVEQPDGKLIAVANFSYFIGSLPQKGIGRLNRDGSLDPTFKPGSDLNADSVNAVLLQPDGRILVSGRFTSINGVTRPSLWRRSEKGFDPRRRSHAFQFQRPTTPRRSRAHDHRPR